MHIRAIPLIPDPLHLLPPPLRGIAEPEFQLVLGPILLNHACDVHVVRDVHVPRLEHELAVEVHRDDGVQAIEDESCARG